MKKITDFIVNKRYIILISFLILTVISLLLSNKVNVNYDMSKYLPNSSETRIGMDIMESEFDNNLSTLNIMLKDLSDKELEDAYNYLNSIDSVSEIEYEIKDNYILYTLTLELPADSKEASLVYKNIEKHFDNIVDTSGDVSDYNKTVLPLYIILLAVGSAVIILIIMCESYFEPFLFLISILIAVALNTGSNLMFSSVSNITNSISAILQMALSMDYSIMLMNRYRQEREHEKDKTNAMRKTLYNSFKSISSSSITTIVGLLALVFMSFTIGKDLGFVLAKGVLLSLLSIFTVLPCLILMSDKIIIKTKKKSPIIRINLLGKLSYKFRYVILILFVGVFIASSFLKGNLGYTYTSSNSEEIEDNFNLNNKIAIIYPNIDEDVISKYCLSLEDKEEVNEVLCYGNTINLPLTYNRLNDKLNALGSDVTIDDYLLKIIYYHYYNKDENNLIELNNLLNFIKSTVYDNDKMNNNIDSEMKYNIERLSKFTNSNEIKKKRNYKEIASTLNMTDEGVKDILIYYNSKNTTNKMTISEFVEFMNKNILTNNKYSSSIDKNSIENLSKISKFIDKDILNKEMSYIEMSKLFGIDEELVNKLYIYYINSNEINDKLTIDEFARFTNALIKSDDYSSLFDEDAKNNIKVIMTFSNKDIITKEMTYSELSNLFEMDEATVNYLLSLIGSDSITPQEFVSSILESEIILSKLDEITISKLQALSFIMMNTLNDVKYSYQEISEYFNINTNITKSIYGLYLKENKTLTPYEFINFVLLHKEDDILKDNLTLNLVSDLELLKNIMDSVLNNQEYSTIELSKLLGIDNDTLTLIYSLYDSSSKEITISFQEFVSFLINDVMNNREYKDIFNTDIKNKLSVVNKIINNSLNNQEYNKDEVFNLLLPLSSNLDKKLIDLVYIYYGSVYDYNDNYTLTIEEFIRFLNNNILKDNRFDDYIDSNMYDNIIDGKDMVKDAKELLIGDKYSRAIINTNLPLESENTFEFIQNIEDELGNKMEEFYIIGDSLVAYDMSKDFEQELNFITILTMIFIFIVVAFTFKSLLIPIILVLLIECAVFLTMGILSFGDSVYFISILIVQSILMGATIDYAILYTSYYLETREKKSVKESVIEAYNNSIHTILTSAFVLIIVTFIVGKFSNAVCSKICMTLCEGTICSAILILLLLPAVLSACDKFIIKKHK